MRQQQILRIVFLRLTVAFFTFTIGVCTYVIWSYEQSAKIDKQDVAIMNKPAQPVILQTNDSLPEPIRLPKSPFDPTGDYHPTSQVTVESEKFLQFVLEVRRRKGRLVAWGHVSNVVAFYKFNFVSVNEKHLKFRTRTIKGVHYRFNGHFLGEGNFSDQYSGHNGSVFLKGTLQKFVNGQKVFEITTPFVHYPGC